MTPLEELKYKYLFANERFAFNSISQGGEMNRVADAMEKSFGIGRAPNEDLVAKTLRKFLETGTLESYSEIKTACYGLLIPVLGSTTIISNDSGLTGLLELVNQYNAFPKKLKRCFQAIMHSYFTLDAFGIGSEYHAQWILLRQCLRRWLPVLSTLECQPDWLATVVKNQSLFGDYPTQELGEGVALGSHDEFDTVCERLAVPATSWVRRQVIISAIECATSQNDEDFIRFLPTSLELINKNHGLRSEGLSMLLGRYANCLDNHEHEGLRMLALDSFGNPLILANKPRWFGVSEKALDMVSNWLKGFLIERFFELLSHDGHTDKRRPRFWLRHRQSIENIWFILGPSAHGSWNDDFKKLRGTMGNQCLALDDGTAGNNAFVMKLGKIYVVEFGETGNATFLYKSSNLPFDLSLRRMSLHKLKTGYDDRLVHIDGRIKKWESKFSEALSRYGVAHDQPHTVIRSARSQERQSPAHVVSTAGILKEFRKFCNERGLRYDDRALSGRLVVYSSNGNMAIAQQLQKWGFVFYDEEKRWIRAP